jgi:hypothetical protein
VNLYLDHRGVYWFGDEEGAVPLAPTAAQFLEGVKASLSHAANVDRPTQLMISASLEFVDLVRPDAVEPPLRLVARDPGTPTARRLDDNP